MFGPPLPPGLSRWPFGLVVPHVVGCQARQFFPQLAPLLLVETIPDVQLLLELQQKDAVSAHTVSVVEGV
jgi:hypothetical protein